MHKRRQRYLAHPNIGADARAIVEAHPGTTLRGIQRRLPYRVAIEQIQAALETDVILGVLQRVVAPTGHHYFRSRFQPSELLLALGLDKIDWAILDHLRSPGSWVPASVVGDAVRKALGRDVPTRTIQYHLKKKAMGKMVEQRGVTYDAHYRLRASKKHLVEDPAFRDLGDGPPLQDV